MEILDCVLNKILGIINKKKIMKKIKLLSLFLFTTVLLFINCSEQENKTYDSVNGQTLLNFKGTSAVIPVDVSAVSSITLTVEVSSVSNTDRKLSISIDNSSTASADQYVLSDVIVPAGQYIGTGTVTGVYAKLPALGAVKLVLKLTGIENSEAKVDINTYTVSMERFCDLDLSSFLGTYSAIGSFNGGAFGPIPDVTVTAGPEAGTFKLTNLYGAGRSSMIELDFSDTKNPLVVHRSVKFLTLFSVTSGYNTYTDDSYAKPGTNTFNTCNNEIKLSFFRNAGPGAGYFPGEYFVVMTKK